MNRPALWIDTETYSEVDIKAGTDNYSRAAEIVLFAYAYGDNPVQVWDCTLGGPIPADLKRYLADDEIPVVAHNATFDRNVLAQNGYKIAPERWRCTMAQALAHGLPGGLEKLCDIFQIGEDKAKLKDGKALVLLFCKPQKFKHTLNRDDYATAKEYRAALAAAREAWQGKATRETHPAEWARYVQYCGNDVEAMRVVARKMPKWNYQGRELDLWHADQRVNTRGVNIDMDLVRGAIETAKREKEYLAGRAQELTDYDAEAGTGIKATTQRSALLELLNEQYDCGLEDLKGSTIERLLKTDHNMPAVVVELLENRLAASSTSVSKYESFAKLTGPDNRLRNTIQFCGASRTGRDAGRGVQLQNLPRPTLKQKQIDQGIADIKADCADLIWPNVMALLSSSVRGCIIPTEGRKLVVADLSNIEGRMLAWLAGEEWKLQAFRDFDTCMGEDGRWYTGDEIRDAVLAGKPLVLKLDEKGEPIRKGHDLYALAYAKAFGVTPEAVMDNKKNGDGSWRQIGKVMELACLGPDTQVVTNNGIKDITAVSYDDLLWDGQVWVSHRGLVAKGLRPVVNVAGVKVTPDHLIRTGRTWTQAQELVSSESTLSRALETGSANLPWSESRGKSAAHVISTWFASSVRAALNRIWCSTTTCEKGNQPGAMFALKSNQDTGEKTSLGMRIFAQMMTRGECYSTGFLPVSTAATIPTTPGTQITAGGESTFTSLGARIVAHFSNTCSQLMAGTTRRSTSTGSTLTGDTSQGTSDSSRGSRIRPTAEKSRTCNGESLTSNEKIQTYDIAYSGPRNCFTVISDRGPLIVHNCGYQGSVGAFATFAIAYGTDLDEMARNAIGNIPKATLEKALRSWKWAVDKDNTYGMAQQTYMVCWSFVRLWRDANPNIEKLWTKMETAFRNAILTPGATFTAGKVRIVKTGNWVRMVLPSGRSLCYPSPRLEGENEKLTCMGINQFTRQWTRLKTYGGKLVENATQGASRCLLKASTFPIEQAGYDLLIPVHDEDITEADDDPKFNSDHLAALMADNPPWADGLPLAAAGYESYRYRKD